MERQIKKLCKRAKCGDKNAADELLKMFYQDIFSYLQRICGCRADAEDLTQETFAKVWVSLASYRGRSRFSTWVYKIALNTYLDCRRRKGCVQNIPSRWWQECMDKNPGPFTTAAEKNEAQRLYRAVEQLDEAKKQVVHLHYYQGLSLRETAEVLDVATSTVKYRLREVMKFLRTELGVKEKLLKQKETILIPKGELS